MKAKTAKFKVVSPVVGTETVTQDGVRFDHYTACYRAKEISALNPRSFAKVVVMGGREDGKEIGFIDSSVADCVNGMWTPRVESDGDEYSQRDGENERREARRQRDADLRAEYPMARDSAGCECKGWCGCHKPGWPAGETCDCKAELDFEDVA